mgnify:CR=1 FL=1
MDAFQRASALSQVKTTDPYVDGGMSPQLSQVLATVVAYFQAENFQGALTALQEGFRNSPSSPSLHFNASLAHEMEGNHLQAKRHAEEYLTLAPNALDAGSVRSRIARPLRNRYCIRALPRLWLGRAT